jgi:hypothetical protein
LQAFYRINRAAKLSGPAARRPAKDYAMCANLAQRALRVTEQILDLDHHFFEVTFTPEVDSRDRAN